MADILQAGNRSRKPSLTQRKKNTIAQMYKHDCPCTRSVLMNIALSDIPLSKTAEYRTMPSLHLLWIQVFACLPLFLFGGERNFLMCVYMCLLIKSNVLISKTLIGLRVIHKTSNIFQAVHKDPQVLPLCIVWSGAMRCKRHQLRKHDWSKVKTPTPQWKRKDPCRKTTTSVLEAREVDER